ncbi:Fatty acid desaturase [Stieleria maiorica]|uniref:Fatty acid desaturase n=1 Tax=Stieleria maiorica TaxID=2795974 RepID=A0A5B9MEY1_9BACT|nr:fatty acid desaturase [Stieleria maiorica]QEF99658.1 Fatty acid desaturase [Stieleria maiorica]
MIVNLQKQSSVELQQLKAEIEPLAKPNAMRWFLCIAFDWFWIVAAFVAMWLLIDAPLIVSIPGWLACLIVIGARQHGIGLMAHEGAHLAVSSNRRRNDLITGLFSFWFLGIALRPYRRFHFSHHRHVGTKDDPELKHKLHPSPFLRHWKLPLQPVKDAVICVLDLFGGGVPHSAYAIGVLMAPRRLIDFVIPKLYQVAWVIGLYFMGLWWVALVWFLALGTTFWMSFRIRIWTEHVVEQGADDPTQRISAKWWQRFLFLPHQTWCHWEHHFTWDVLRQRVPSWNLAHAREILSGDGFPPVRSLESMVKSLRSAPPSLGTLTE